MKNRVSSRRDVVAAMTCSALMLGMWQADGARAQQPKNPPPAAAPAAGAQQQQSAWVKLCEKTPQTKLGPDGKPQLDRDNKPVMEERTLCLTHHEQMTNVGVTMVSAAIQQLEGIEKLHMMVMIPPVQGIIMPAGVSVVVYTREQVEKLQKKERLDEKELIGQKLMFTICHQNGCTAENEATPQLLDAMRKGAVMVAFATHPSGQPIPFEVPLTGFAATFAGKPVDNELYRKQREGLQQTFMANRLEMMKQMQSGPQAPAAAQPPAAATKGPAKK
jgi:invasion protein IalB